MDVIDTINKINDSYIEVYDEYGYTYLNSNPIVTFNNGFCYEYHLLLKRFFYTAELVMQNDKMHCATLIDNNIYDVNGIREDIENFHIATGCDMEYIYKYYGFLPERFRENLNKTVTHNVLSKNKVKII